ncbi:MAG: FG-GAP repeat protein [Spirochaetales bacterium]|nr:FG-GAP repeat protein [Spirochaetales bacterium]
MGRLIRINTIFYCLGIFICSCQPPGNDPPPEPFSIEDSILHASDKQDDDHFGATVAISGDYALVGAVLEDGGLGDPFDSCGAAYVFERNGGGVWEEKQILHASDCSLGDEFGFSLAVSGEYAIIGAPYEDGGVGNPVSNGGAAYIFERNGGGVWEEKKILRASDAFTDDWFGYAVAISGDYAIVAAYSEDGGDGNPVPCCGAAYVFERNVGGVWEEKQILHASDRQDFDCFGQSVALSGSFAIVGAHFEDGGIGDPTGDGGAAYVFERNGGGVWEEKQILHASDKQNMDYFGYSVALYDTHAVVGAAYENGGLGDPASNGGAAYVFERNAGGVWEDEQILHASDMQSSDYFGCSVDIHTEYLIIGANREDGGVGDPYSACGAAYIYELSAGGQWEEVTILHASDRQLSDYFGTSVAIDGSYALAGASIEDGGAGDFVPDCGAVYIYR